MPAGVTIVSNNISITTAAMGANSYSSGNFIDQFPQTPTESVDAPLNFCFMETGGGLTSVLII